MEFYYIGGGIILVLGTFLLSNFIARWINKQKFKVLEDRYNRMMTNRGQRPKIPVTIITGMYYYRLLSI